MPGLITRIGLWVDNRWEDKATVRQMDGVERRLESKAEMVNAGVIAAFKEINERIQQLQDARSDERLNKELADLKTRMEKIEMYTGMTRKVDPTKPAVAKSAFSM